LFCVYIGFVSGAYTTARTFQHNSVFEFSFHVNRLVESCSAMLLKQHSSISAALAPLQSAAALRPVLINNLSHAMQDYDSLYPTLVDAELKVTILVTWSENNDSFDVYTHLCPLPSVPAPPIKVHMRRADRKQYAAAKDTQWVRDRTALEQNKPADVNEIMLVDDAGCVMEGMSSNFGVLIGDGTPADPIRLQTADADILKGTVREILLRACVELGVPVELRPPQIAESHLWRAAFVSSTSRLVLPVDWMYSPEASTADSTLMQLPHTMELAANPIAFSHSAAQQLLEQLRQTVLQRIEAASENVRSVRVPL
jgi:branched-subunit amino acid aminotransferase/4-amino-4-deoxychorismate lyase